MTKYLLLFAYLTFLGGTVYSDMNYGLRIAHQLIVSGIVAVWLLRMIRRRESWPKTGLELPLILFTGVRFASNWAGTEPRMSLELFWQPLTHLFLFYWLVWLFRGNEKRRVLRAYFLVMGVVCTVGIAEFLGWYLGLPFLPAFQQGWPQIGGLTNPIPPSNWRLNFTLSSATSLSTYLSLLIPPAILMAIRARRKDMRAGWLILVASALIVQILTRSRGGLLGLLVSAVFAVATYAVLCRERAFILWRHLARSRVLWCVGGILGVAVLASAIIILPAYVGRLDNLLARAELWKCAAQTLATHPFLGVGTGGFGRAWRTCAPSSTLKFDFYTTAHNLYLNIAAEFGTLGIAAFVFLVAMLVIRIRRRWQLSQDPSDQMEVIAITAALVGYAVNCLFDTLTSTPLVLPVILLVAWLIAPLEKRATIKQLQPTSPLALLVVVLYLGGLLWVDFGQWYFEKGIAAATQGDYVRALESSERARLLDPSLTLYDFQRAFYLGQLAHQNPGRYLAPAIAAQESAVQLEGSYSVHLANLAALYWQNGDADKALEFMQRALEMVPPEPDIWLNYGLMAEQAALPDKATDAYASTLAEKPERASSGFWLASPFRRQSFEEILRLAIEKGAEPCDLWFAAGNLEQALKSVSVPLTGTDYEQRGRILLEKGALQKSAVDLTRAIGLCPDCPGAYVSRSLIFWQSGSVLDAERDARTALFIGSNGSERAHQTLAWIALGEGDLETAIGHLWRAVRPEGDEYNWEAVLYNRHGDFTLLPQLLHIEGGALVFAPWLELADLYASQDRPDKAAAVYRLVLDRDPFVPGVREQLAALEGN